MTKQSKERACAWQKKYQERLKIEALQVYGTSCVDCGERQSRFLQLTFPNRDRLAFLKWLRKECGRNSRTYWMLKKAGYPRNVAIEVRCLNCNWKLEMLRKSPRMRCLIAYGGDPPRCACCGIDDASVLTIDHVLGRSDLPRKERRSRGPALYYRLAKLGFPNKPPLAVLCWNCNRGRWANGGICPHQA